MLYGDFLVLVDYWFFLRVVLREWWGIKLWVDGRWGKVFKINYVKGIGDLFGNLSIIMVEGSFL